MKHPDPAFPPLLDATSVDQSVDPFTEAARRAHRGKCGAGDVLWSRATSVAQMAVVLEPEVALARAMQIAPMSMVAMGDALGVLCPPQVSVHFRWPGDILINGARAGEVILASAQCGLSDVPRWLVIGLRLQIKHDRHDREPGEMLDRTCLVEEGIGADLTRSDIIQSLASYWMAGLNNWLDEGLSGCHERWVFRAEGREEPVTIHHLGETKSGTVLGLDDEAGLLLRPDTGEAMLSLSYEPYVRRLGAMAG